MKAKKLTIIAIIIAALAMFFIFKPNKIEIFNPKSNAAQVEIKACILYSGDSETWKETYSQLQQSELASMTVSAVEFSSDISLNEYTIIYPDESIINTPEAKNPLTEYVKNGGNLFLTNGFLNYFDKDFLGAAEIVKIEKCPEDIVFPKKDAGYSEIQGVISDYNYLYKKYNDYKELKNKDYGFGILPDTAVSIANTRLGASLYGFNSVGKGRVFYANKLLPNAFHISSADFVKSDENQLHYNNTDTTANRLIRSKFAAYISKEIYGHVIERVFGPNGIPAAAWQLHYEEITGIENNSSVLFSEICKKYDQIPSFTLIRNSYKWFSRFETISYLLSDNGGYNIDFKEGAYTSGRHVIENDKIFKISEFEDRGSYFEDYPQYDEYAAPKVLDYNNDKIPDIITGSSDGHMYFYKGISADKNEWKTEYVKILTNPKGDPIKVAAYSAPDFTHIDNDDILDLISGCKDGNVYWFKGNPDFTFEEQGILIASKGTNSIPSAGVIENKQNILVGYKEGMIKCYQGDNEIDINISGKGYIAPYIHDGDIFVGTTDGYIKKFINKGNFTFEDSGYIEGREKNYKGNNYLKFGNNCVPCFYDIDGDGNTDLIAGSLEYGLAVPIDSPYFKFKDTLKEQILYMKQNYFYLGAHFYTNEYASKEREEEELRLQKEAFKSYGINTDNIGANQHTWYISKENDTFLTQLNGGILWNSGFRSRNAPISPEASTETVLSSTYFLDYDKRDMLIFNTIPFFGSYPETAKMTAKYNLPVSFYYHCDFAYENLENAENNVKMVSDFLESNNYNMIREDQLAKASAAALNTIAEVETTADGKINIYKKALKTDFPLYDKKYFDSVGYKISFSDGTKAEDMSSRAEVFGYDAENNCVYIGGTSLSVERAEKTEKTTVLSVNLPAEITKKSIKFLDDGYMQVIFSGTDVKVNSNGWKRTEKDGKTIISKFGKAETLKFE